MFAYQNVKATLLRPITKTFLYLPTLQHNCTPHRLKYNCTNYKSHTSNKLLFSNRKRDSTNAHNRNILYPHTLQHQSTPYRQKYNYTNYKSHTSNNTSHKFLSKYKNIRVLFYFFFFRHELQSIPIHFLTHIHTCTTSTKA